MQFNMILSLTCVAAVRYCGPQRKIKTIGINIEVVTIAMSNTSLKNVFHAVADIFYIFAYNSSLIPPLKNKVCNHILTIAIYCRQRTTHFNSFGILTVRPPSFSVKILYIKNYRFFLWNQEF